MYERLITVSDLQPDEGVPSTIRSCFTESEIYGKNSKIPELARCIIFSEFVTQLAFLRTVPAPVFNSEVSVLIHNKLFRFKEESLSSLPKKNVNCIKTLCEILDFNTILTCIKALLFDMNLIVFSENISLLFDVVEALK